MPLPDDIVDAGSNFSPSFRVTDELERDTPWTMWEGSFDASGGVSGMWFPSEDWMVVSKRATTHHNQQYQRISKEHGLLSPVMPWVVDHTGGGWHMDIPSSAGGMTQAIFRLEASDDVDSWQHGYQVGPGVLWPAVYVCRQLDIPEETQVRFLYRPDEIASAEGAYHFTETFEMGEAYTELRFMPGGLPEPEIDRGQYL